MEGQESIGNYLIEQIYECGVRHIFGVPGDYVLGFFKQLSNSRISLVNACNEEGAGFMADAYAHVRGLGVVCVTYGVGGMKVVNTTAQAFAERSPVVVISGAPGIKEGERFPFLHHKIREIDTQRKVFEQLTIALTVLNNPETASREIDRVLSSALHYKLPVYIELPRDMVLNTLVHHNYVSADIRKIDVTSLNEAISEAVTMINNSRKPVIVTGVEIHRFGLHDDLLQLAEKTNIPIATTLLSKSVVEESHSLFVGVYEGAMGQEAAREYVESSDCLIVLGTLMTDVYLNIFPSQIYHGQAIYATSEKISISHHAYDNLHIRDFLRGLCKSGIQKKELPNLIHRKTEEAATTSAQKITIKHLFQRLRSFLTKDMIVIADIGESLFGSIDLILPSGTTFLSPTHYASLGFAVPAGVGVQLADRNLRPIVLVGDGAFQMTGIELATAVRYHLNPIVILLNNFGYATERVIIDGPFNDLLPMKYSLFPELLGAGKGVVVETEIQLDQALLEAERNKDSFYLIDIHLDPSDRSPALKRVSNWFLKGAGQGL